VTLVARNAQNLEKAATEVRLAAKESSQKVQCLSSMLFNEIFINQYIPNLYCSGPEWKF
jgi:hypothetical protein